jgi:protein-L-isoaspartate(D-aspartate) O-methyltransferase
MIDYATARRNMIDGQVRTADVTDLDLIAAMAELPRERFLPESVAPLAYLDCDAAVAENQSDSLARRLIKPMVLAKLIQAADVARGDRVLDVGCASGYASAVFARLAGPVVALEEDAALARRAEQILEELGIANVAVVRGALTEGWPAGAPYDVILVEGAIEFVPEAFGRQLRDGGRLVGVFGRAPAGKAMLWQATNGHLNGRPIFDAAAPLLPGFAKPPEFAF